MKKLILLTGFCVSSFAVAEEVIEIDKEDLVIAEEKKIHEEVFLTEAKEVNTDSASKSISKSEPKTDSNSVSKAEPKVVILNNQNQKVDQEAARGQHSQTQMISQPVVRVMGTPISTNYASELKKSRKEAEVQTEQKIVEQLESSRLRDEQERLKKLFGEKSAPKTVVPSESANVQTDKSAIYTEVVSSSEEEGKDNLYVGIYGGQASNLTRSLNISSHGSFGMALGASDESGLRMESQFFYSKHKINDSTSIYNNNENDIGSEDLHQLSGVLSLNYSTSFKRFKPYAGAALSYNYWVYSSDVDTPNACYGVTLEHCDNQSKSDSIDLGANIGVDIMITKKVSIGANILFNIVNLLDNADDNSRTFNRTHYNDNPVNIEETNWLIASINAKLYF